MSALGTRSGLLGQENGTFEAWVYPLKILRNFHLRFRVDDEVIDSGNLARSIEVHPESTTIIYAWDTFAVRETLFTPREEPGAIIHLEIDTKQPLEIEAVFERDFQLEWPGTMGGSDIEWNPLLHAFAMDENGHKFTALVGSPSGTLSHMEFSSNYASDKSNSLRLGLTPPGKATKQIIIAGSFQGLPPVEATYKKLASSYEELTTASTAFYNDYRKSHLSIELPDQRVQQAYEWAQVSVLQGIVTNPYLGTGLVAGYKQSSDNDQRPGYAWFFGRDALWTSLALDAEGDFKTTQTALRFLAKYQRSDGKITHEIAQGASFVHWFDSMPYAYAAADATPLYIVTVADYVRHSGDIAFAQEEWDTIERAYRFIVSTYDNNGIPKNDGIGHGWVEGGPLLPVKNELYQASVVTEALRSLQYLSNRLGKVEESTRLASEYKKSKKQLNQAFWISKQSRYAFALDRNNAQVDTPSVLATVPMWFGLLDDDKARSMIHSLDGPEAQTSWGMRIIQETDPKYDAAGYHSGTVWPLFTGWASVGEYHYHEDLSAYANLRSNALLTFDGSLGHVTEVLSGSYYQTLSSGSPHQIWSAAMVISPLLIGLFGLDVDAQSNQLSFNPHVPADWHSFKLNNLQVGSCSLNISYLHASDKIQLDVENKSSQPCSVNFSPAISLRTSVSQLTHNGRKLPFTVEPNALDQHIKIHLDVSPGKPNAAEHLVITLRNDFGLSQALELPALGATNEGLRVVSEQWSESRDQLTLQTDSASSGVFNLNLTSANQITSVDGAELVRDAGTSAEDARLKLSVNAETGQNYGHHQVTIHFSPALSSSKHPKKGSEKE